MFLDGDELNNVEGEFNHLVNFSLPCRNVMLKKSKGNRIVVSFIGHTEGEDVCSVRRMVLSVEKEEEAQELVNMFNSIKKKKDKTLFRQRTDKSNKSGN